MPYSVRRALVEDVAALKELAADDSFILGKRYGDGFNFHLSIETHYLSITVCNSEDRVVGFASFNDYPPEAIGVPRDSWDTLLHEHWASDSRASDVNPCNAMWITGFVSDGVNDQAVAREVMTTALATCPHVNFIVYALPEETPAFDPICGMLSTLAHAEPVKDVSKFRGSVYSIGRAEVIPELTLRVGVVEDFDDLMPLLDADDGGIVTPLPDNLFLEELLQDQDDHHAVIVAVDPTTETVVGLMCLRATYDEQQHVVKQYATDHLNKLKPQLPNQKHRGQQPNHNLIHVSFFYLNPAYENHAQQFIPRAFEAFPFAEYCMMLLPHAAAVHPVLHDFTYIPIKKLQPSNVQGERLPLPEGLYLVCRYALEPLNVVPVDSSHEADVTKMMSAQTELSQDQSEATCVAFTQSVPVGTVQVDDLPYRSFAVTWRERAVGVIVAAKCTRDESYSLRAKFDLESFINFAPAGDSNYQASDFEADPLEAPKAYHTDAMPALVVKHMYLKPAYRCHLRFALREALRYSKCEVLLYPASAAVEVFAPLVSELILAPPRRTAQFPLTDPTAASEADIVADSIALHFISHKLLSDEKTHVNARIVVVGSGTTGLACIYSMLQIPYLHFSNIALVSQDGLPDHPHEGALQWSADGMEWSTREYLALRIGRKIRVIEGTMIDFDRVDRYIYTDNATCEPFDHLVLTVGRQYALPKSVIEQGAKSGVFPLANAAATNRIKQHIHESEVYEDERSRAVIYGSNLDVFAVAACVTQLELGAQRVVLVSPEEPSFNAFGDEVVARKVDELCEAIGIQRYVGHRLERLELDEDKNLSSVVIAPSDKRDGAAGKLVEIDATMLLFADEKDIDTQVLSALNKRSIVFDGRVIVENCYRTTDRNIYAAGPVAMFSRRFGPCDDFDMFNTLEVGRHLAHTILGFLNVDEFVDADLSDEGRSFVPKDDPLAAQLGTFREAPPDDLARRRPRPLPVYSDNVCRRVALPTGLLFFTCYSVEYAKSEDPSVWRHLTSWSRETCPIGTQQNTHTVAANVMNVHDEERCYIRVSVGDDGTIASVAYLGRDPRCMENLRGLVGTAESTLNLCYNYDETANVNGEGAPGLDILEYLEGLWARAVFHDRFAALNKRLREKIQGLDTVQSVRRQMLSTFQDSSDVYLSEDSRRVALHTLTTADGEMHKVVEKEIIKFLHDHKAFLPQRYYLPDMAEMRSSSSNEDHSV